MKLGFLKNKRPLAALYANKCRKWLNFRNILFLPNSMISNSIFFPTNQYHKNSPGSRVIGSTSLSVSCFFFYISYQIENQHHIKKQSTEEEKKLKCNVFVEKKKV